MQASLGHVPAEIMKMGLETAWTAGTLPTATSTPVRTQGAECSPRPRCSLQPHGDKRDLLHCRDFIHKYILFVMSHSQ